MKTHSPRWRRRRAAVGTGLALLLGPGNPAAAQDHQHHDHGAGHAHGHAGVLAECRTLAAPPWSGLSPADRDAVHRVETAVQALRSPEAAARAEFTPVFGNLPTMGVHWVNARRMRAGFRLEEPDHLLFAPIAGEQTLVGVAYAFRGARDAELPTAFESDLARWHNHPELAGPGQTLHMLHVWFVASPYGPFAGNNFFLPFLSGGVHAPNPCWFESPEDVERLELVGALLEILNRGRDPALYARSGVRGQQGPLAVLGQGQRGGLLRGLVADLSARLEPRKVALDGAARVGDRDGWVAAADALLQALAPVERQVITYLRDLVKGAQAPGRLRI